jgi:hypothetical protein
MKILFSADWHLKLGTKNIPDEWAINRYNILFNRLHELESEAYIHIIGGDLFDRLPNMGELELYFKYISGCKTKTIIYPGNHEALKKDTTFLTHLKEATFAINPLVTIHDDYFSFLNVDIIPYNKLKEFEKNPIDFQGNILCTHVRGEIPPHVKPEVPLELFDRWKIVLAGDLHSYSNSQRNILYPGSPVTTSFHRSLVDTGVIFLDTDTLKHEWVKLEVPQLIRKTIKAGEEMVADPYHHVIYEVEGDMDELSNISDHELLDKKVVKRDTDVALILEPEMTLAQEVEEYLRYILQVSDESVEKALQVLNDNITKIKME